MHLPGKQGSSNNLQRLLKSSIHYIHVCDHLPLTAMMHDLLLQWLHGVLLLVMMAANAQPATYISCNEACAQAQAQHICYTWQALVVCLGLLNLIAPPVL